MPPVYKIIFVSASFRPGGLCGVIIIGELQDNLKLGVSEGLPALSANVEHDMPTNLGFGFMITIVDVSRTNIVYKEERFLL
ncbi:hypothetical protein RRF57_003211 [Xylaria bambusicola]|uniref:Uncharacterized protein n=1 Tax=Xylaria bambusicola TaxID=326684 RepID=A0AAN7Z2J3_9PEZI